MNEPLPTTSTRSLRDAARPKALLTSLRGAVLGSLLASLAAQAALLGTGVLTARALGPTDRGYIALVILVPTILTLSGTLGLPLATTYFIASDRARESAVLRAILRPACIQTAVLIVIQNCVVWALVHDEPRRVQIAAVAVAPLLVGALADTYGKAILQGQGRYTTFNVLRANVVTLYLLCVLVLVSTGNDGIEAFAVAYMGSSLAAGALTLTIALTRRSSTAASTSPVSTLSLFAFGLRGHVSSLSPVASFRLDQVAIGLFLPPRALGLYVAALAFTYLPEMLSRGVGMIALPQVASAVEAKRIATARDLFVLAVVLNATTVVCLELSAGFLVPFLFGSDFEDAVTLTRLLLVGSLFWGARHILTDLAGGLGRPGVASVAEIAAWVALIPSMALLGTLWGVSGVAVAMSISAITSCSTIVYLLRRSLRARVAGPPARTPDIEP